jgi:hypothetical protein
MHPPPAYSIVVSVTCDGARHLLPYFAPLKGGSTILDRRERMKYTLALSVALLVLLGSAVILFVADTPQRQLQQPFTYYTAVMKPK